MSHEVDERYAVYSETRRRAIKQHKCSACKEAIRPGHTYHVIAIIFEGVESLKRCERCQAIHLHLRTLDRDMWPDERLNCGEEYREHWGREPPPEIAAMAFALPGEVKA